MNNFNMIVKNLADVSFDQFIDCFLLSFENYYVELPTDKEYYKNRWKAANVNFNLSYGIFQSEELVGFVIHAIDNKNGKLTAFNTGTGIIPAFRGKRFIKSIYEYALRDLKLNGIEISTLEVITENERAIRSYKSVGFEICKRLKCFTGRLKINDHPEVELKEIDLEKIQWDQLPNQALYSWDNQAKPILKGNYKFFQVWSNEMAESFFVINPDNGYIAQFDLLNTSEGAWSRLFSGIHRISQTVKINNVDDRLNDKIDTLIGLGLKNTIDQYEMKLKLTDGNNP